MIYLMGELVFDSHLVQNIFHWINNGDVPEVGLISGLVGWGALEILDIRQKNTKHICIIYIL